MGNLPLHKARKRFGQHFLHDRNIITKLINAISPKKDDFLLEIGPGQGALTFPLLQACQYLTAIELDRDLIPILQQKSSEFGELELINQDILKFELETLKLHAPIRLVGNLPYNISTPLMFHLLKSVELIQDMHFMVQKEVAQRIVANAGEPHYSRLSVMMQYFCQCQFLFGVAPGCFSPPPKVDSSIIRLVPHIQKDTEVNDFDLFSLIVKSAFNQRRKTIINSLKKVVDPSIISELGINPKSRAENLFLQDYAAISQAQSELKRA